MYKGIKGRLVQNKNDKDSLQSALNSYGLEQWESLEKRLKEIQKPYKEGLYRVELGNSDWEIKPNTA